MTALWIILGIIVLIVFILMISITVYVNITDQVTVSVGLLGYKYKIDLDSEADKTFKKKKNKKKKAVEEAKPKSKSNERSFGETVKFSILLLRSIVPSAVKMVSRIRIISLKLYMVIACENADDTAIFYGKVCSGIYTLLGILDAGLKLKVKYVDIVPDFVTGECKYHISFKAKLRIFHILIAAVVILFKLLVNTMNIWVQTGHDHKDKVQKLNKAVQ